MSMKHGASHYRARRACRCEICTADHAARKWREKVARAARVAEMPAGNHGTESGYTNWDCRCPGCTRANTEACKARRARRRVKPDLDGEAS